MKTYKTKIRGGSCQFEKIRELREEKARLASEQYKDPELERVKKLIQERGGGGQINQSD